jgi:hypothetical protein
MRCAEAGVKGSTEATGRAHALARPCVARVHALACLGVLGAYGLASVSLSCAKGWRGHDQGREGRLLDMLKVRG